MTSMFEQSVRRTCSTCVNWMTDNTHSQKELADVLKIEDRGVNICPCAKALSTPTLPAKDQWKQGSDSCGSWNKRPDVLRCPNCSKGDLRPFDFDMLECQYCADVFGVSNGLVRKLEGDYDE